MIRGNIFDTDYMERHAPVVDEAIHKLPFALAVRPGWKIKKGGVTFVGCGMTSRNGLVRGFGQ